MTKQLWNCDTSWRCVQALAVILTILLLPGTGGALDPGIDLLDALNLHSNLSQYQGVTITPSRVFHLSGLDRNLVLPAAVFHRAVEQMKKSPEFTFSVVLKQEQSNSGTIISFSNGINRYLELQSSGRRDEIRFHYTHITAAGATQILTETFPYRLADDIEHKVSLTVSGTEMQLFIDCHPLYKRVTHFLPDRNFSASNMQLFVGQRNSNSHYLFKGEIKDLRLITGSYGYLSQCELMDAQCPTCGQFLELENALLELKQTMSLLTKRLVEAEKRVSYIEECDCKKSCLINGTTKNDGDAWDIGCSRCECKQGVVKCGPRPCPEVKCKHPVLKEGECCPVCLKSCYITKKDFEHGEIQILGCRNCSCVDGNMHCEFLQCPELKCPPEQQMSVTDECCKFCQDTPHRRKARPHKRPHGGGGGGGGNRRQHHKNSTHRNKHSKKKKHEQALQLQATEDVDECTQQGGLNGNHCHLNTRCVNTFGSYICECLPGYRRQDKFNCVEMDECKSGDHNCHENADCINTLGSYHCQCKEGYTGNGRDCKPVCNQTCLNGGECRSPNVCTCRTGYIGESCEKDLDECATGLHRCKDTTDCVNMPGWYFCKCKAGFETKGKECVDIDECYLNTHSCHPTAQCVNTPGHFRCECPAEGDPDCRLSCMFEDRELRDGDKVSPSNAPCKMCTCSKGVISCVEPPCNCSSWRPGVVSELCCPQCDPKQSCQHQELKHVTFRSGEQWIYQCQTCECLYGEFDCWKLECPPLTCDNPMPAGPADCCPRCPDDRCGFANLTKLITSSGAEDVGVGTTCLYGNHVYPPGPFKYPSRECTTCSCKNGKITCRYDDNCTVANHRGALRMVEELNANSRLNASSPYHNQPSQATTPKMLEHQLLHRSLPHRTATTNSLSKAATRVDRTSRNAMPPTEAAAAETGASSTISSKQPFNQAPDEAAIERTFAAVSTKVNAGVIAAEPVGSRLDVAPAQSSRDENLQPTVSAITDTIQPLDPDERGQLAADAQHDPSSAMEQRAASSDGTTTVQPTAPQQSLAAAATTTKTHRKRSLLQTLPFIDSVSDTDVDPVAPSRHTNAANKRSKRSERG
ncbi:protein kinase C-binding protein NELL1-like isoform X4 [Anopheles stephensi]|uniref:protein kinase C-binding protein NELL1-like isoform X4 n=1 Tax=Anopheles stephensi TaxID=30069 RepID=UPI0016588983|nr:protein kinase C-binding protein NELL1-like isoform X4 [Anopheles stephensi]